MSKSHPGHHHRSTRHSMSSSLHVRSPLPEPTIRLGLNIQRLYIQQSPKMYIDVFNYEVRSSKNVKSFSQNL